MNWFKVLVSSIATSLRAVKKALKSDVGDLSWLGGCLPVIAVIVASIIAIKTEMEKEARDNKMRQIDFQFKMQQVGRPLPQLPK